MCLAACRTQLEQWAKDWDAPHFLCSDQLQFRQWLDDAWPDWLPPNQFSMAASSPTVANTSRLHEAVRASAGEGSRVSYSDAVRFLLLYKFGGMYIDGDVLLLRNLEPFAHYDFVYEWSYVKEGMNTAMCGAAEKGEFAGAVIQAALRAAVSVESTTGKMQFDASMFNDAFHPLELIRRIPAEFTEGVEALPSTPFDALWLTLDAPATKTKTITQLHNLRYWDDFFTKPPSYVVPHAAPADVFKGAFAYHWHNRWSAQFDESSLIGQLVSTYESFLQGRVPNPHGLHFNPCHSTNSSAG
jgi:hypothetical protein